MNRELHLEPKFGTFLAEGTLAAEFRLREIEPAFHTFDVTTLDFTGVRNANSSFVNALIVPVVETNGPEAIERLRFKGCNPIVRVMVESALTLGLQRATEAGEKRTFRSAP
jgi:hypothetical protein